MIKKTTKIICTIWFFCNLFSCGQKKEAPLTGKEELALTEDNFVPVLHNEVKKYPNVPLYYLHLTPINCNYEVLINDFPVYNSLKHDDTASAIHINNAILQTGLQKICYYLYPETGKKILEDSSELQINICRHQIKKEEEHHEMFISYPSPKIELKNGRKISEASGKKIYMNNLLFHAEVPYKNKGWSNGQNLQDFDSLTLKRAVISFYQHQLDILKQNKKDEMFTLLYKKEKERVVSEYINKDEIKLILQSYLELFNISLHHPQSLEKYKVSFYGNGKLVRLEYQSENLPSSTENQLQKNSKSPLLSFYLYLPNGKNLNNGLEIIR